MLIDNNQYMEGTVAVRCRCHIESVTNLYAVIGDKRKIVNQQSYFEYVVVILVGKDG